MPPFARDILLAILGAFVALLGWNGETAPAAITLIPLLWMLTPAGRAAFALTFGYFSASTWVLAEGAVVFGSSVGEILVMVSAWLVQASLLAGLWAFAREWGRGGFRLLLAGLLVQISVLVPPLWLVGVASPVLAWGYLMGGSGWLGLVVGLVAPLALGLWLISMRSSDRFKIIASILPVIALASYTVDLDTRSSAGAYAVQTRWGDSGQSGFEHVLLRYPKIVAAVEVLRKSSGTTTVVFPEAILGTVFESSGVAGEFDLVRPLARQGLQVLIGADRRVDGRLVESIMVINRDQRVEWVNARQPTPGSLWRPWSQDGYAADWWSVPRVTIADGRVALISFCHEDVMPGFFLSALLMGEPPDLVISVANNWWMRSDFGSRQQAQHALALPKLFAIPIIRSVNRAGR